jgi:hypothetical protein
VFNGAQPAEAAAEADVRRDATSEVVAGVPADDAQLAGRCSTPPAGGSTTPW